MVGYLSANMLGVPRITFALAENGDFPSIFAAIHPRFRTPYISILAFALLSWLLALLGSFTWNATLSAVARLLYYGLVCAALPLFRRKQPEAAMFRLPGGTLFAILGAGICAVLITAGNLYERIVDPAGHRAGGNAELAAGTEPTRTAALHWSSLILVLSAVKTARLRRLHEIQFPSSAALRNQSSLPRPGKPLHRRQISWWRRTSRCPCAMV